MYIFDLHFYPNKIEIKIHGYKMWYIKISPLLLLATFLLPFYFKGISFILIDHIFSKNHTFCDYLQTITFCDLFLNINPKGKFMAKPWFDRWIFSSMFIQRRLKSAFACVQSDKSLLSVFVVARRNSASLAILHTPSEDYDETASMCRLT